MQTTESKLTSKRVNAIFLDCLFQDGEDTSQHVRAEGIVNTVGFHPARLEAHKTEIVEMLNELPEKFHQNTGGGWSFLNACDDRYGQQWTGEHRTMEQLFLLGMGIGQVKCLMPREMWGMLPGGVPYYMVAA